MIKNYNHFAHNSMYLFIPNMIFKEIISQSYRQHGAIINEIIKIPTWNESVFFCKFNYYFNRIIIHP